MIRQIATVLAVCAGFGLIRMPFESGLFRQEQETGLIIPPAQFERDAPLEQQFSIVALGGLRTLVAAALSIDAFRCFQEKDWPALEKTFNQVVALAPRTPFYWEMAAWHVGTNAASSVGEDESLAPSERLFQKRAYYERGNTFYERGLEVNPDNYSLAYQYAQTLSNRAFFPDYDKAAAMFLRAYSIYPRKVAIRNAFYNVSRNPSRMREAYALGKELFQDPANRMPTLRGLLFAQQNALDIPEAERIPFLTLFETNQQAATILTNYINDHDTFPLNGVRAKLYELKNSLKQAP